jgi:hypothetical protein
MLFLPGELRVCAGHGTEPARWKSSRQVFAESKVRKSGIEPISHLVLRTQRASYLVLHGLERLE